MRMVFCGCTRGFVVSGWVAGESVIHLNILIDYVAFISTVDCFDHVHLCGVAVMMRRGR